MVMGFIAWENTTIRESLNIQKKSIFLGHFSCLMDAALTMPEVKREKRTKMGFPPWQMR